MRGEANAMLTQASVAALVAQLMSLGLLPVDAVVSDGGCSYQKIETTFVYMFDEALPSNLRLFFDEPFPSNNGGGSGGNGQP